MALAFFYLFCSFEDPLPWTKCDPAWVNEDDLCYSSAGNLTGLNFTGLKSSTELLFK